MRQNLLLQIACEATVLSLSKEVIELSFHHSECIARVSLTYNVCWYNKKKTNKERLLKKSVSYLGHSFLHHCHPRSHGSHHKAIWLGYSRPYFCIETDLLYILLHNPSVQIQILTKYYWMRTTAHLKTNLTKFTNTVFQCPEYLIQ